MLIESGAFFVLISEVIFLNIKTSKFSKFSKFATSIFLFCFCVASLSSCLRFTNISTANKIEAKLKETYNESFVVDKIGKYDALDPYSSVRAYCHSTSNPDAVFFATYDPRTELLTDEYYLALLENKAEKELKANSNLSNIDFLVKVEVDKVKSSELSKETTLAEALSDKEDAGLYIDICVFEPTSEDCAKIFDGACEFMQTYKDLNANLSVGTSVVNMPTSTKEICQKEFLEMPFVTKNFYDRNGFINYAHINADHYNIEEERTSFIADMLDASPRGSSSKEELVSSDTSSDMLSDTNSDIEFYSATSSDDFFLIVPR